MTPETAAACNCPPSWLALTALSTVRNIKTTNASDRGLRSSTPPPATMACCGSIPPSTAPTTGSAAAALVVEVAGAPSSDHLNVTHFLGRDVHDQVFAPARHPAVPAPEQGLHGNGHLTAGAAEQLLQLVHAYTGSGLSDLDSNCRRAVWTNTGSSSI